MRHSRTLCYAWAAMLSVRTPGSSRRVAGLTRLFASFLAENYTVYWPETIRSREKARYRSPAVTCCSGLTSLKTGSYFPYRNLVDLLTRRGLFRVL